MVYASKQHLLYFCLALFLTISEHLICEGRGITVGCQPPAKSTPSGKRTHLTKTLSGRTCQNWSSQTPHQHGRTPDRYKNANLTQNFCRNPDGYYEIWCYTTDKYVRWELCALPECSGDCSIPDTRDLLYRGTIATTVSGRTCQHWKDQSPHKHTRTPEKYPYGGLEANYCRNPDNYISAWCYTTDPDNRWEVCSVPKCEEKKELKCYRTLFTKNKHGRRINEQNEMTCSEDSVCLSLIASGYIERSPENTIAAYFGMCFPKSSVESASCEDVWKGMGVSYISLFKTANCNLSFCDENLCNEFKEPTLPVVTDAPLFCTTSQSTKIGRSMSRVSSSRKCGPNSVCFALKTDFTYTNRLSSLTEISQTGCLYKEFCAYLSCDHLPAFLPGLFYGQKVKLTNCEAKCCGRTDCPTTDVTQSTIVPATELSQPIPANYLGVQKCHRIMFVLTSSWGKTLDAQTIMDCEENSVCLTLIAEGYDTQNSSDTAVAVYGSCFSKSAVEDANCEEILAGMGQRNPLGIDDYDGINNCSLSFCGEELCNGFIEPPLPEVVINEQDKVNDLRCAAFQCTDGSSSSTRLSCGPNTRCFSAEVKVIEEGISKIRSTNIAGCIVREMCEYLVCDQLPTILPNMFEDFSNFTILECGNVSCCDGDYCNSSIKRCF